LKVIPLEQAVKIILRQNKFGLETRDGVWVITRAEDAPATPDTPQPLPENSLQVAASPQDSALKQHVNLDFRDMPIASVVDLLATKAGVNVVAPVGFAGSVTVNLQDIPLEEAMKTILRMNNYEIVKRDGVWEITLVAGAPTSSPESQVLAKDALRDAPTASPTAAEPLQLAQNETDDAVKAKIDGLKAILEKPVSIYFEDIQLRDITDFFTKVSKLNFVFDDRVVPSRGAVKNGDIVAVPVDAGEPPLFRDKNTGAQFPTDGKVPYVNLQNVSIKEALKALLRPLNLGYAVRPEGIWISTSKNILAEVQSSPTDAQHVKGGPTPVASTTAEPPSPTPTAAAPATRATQPTTELSHLEETLFLPVSVFFEKVHIRDIFEYLTDQYEMNIIVDNRVVAPRDTEGKGDFESVPNKSGDGIVFRSKTTGVEFTTDGIVEYVNLRNVSIREALRVVLRPLNLDYAVQPSFLWISTPENIRNETFEELVTRSYQLPQSLSKTLAAVLGSPDESVSEVDIASVKAILDTFLWPITEPGTKKEISILNFDKQTGRLILHYPPSRLLAFEEYLHQSSLADTSSSVPVATWPMPSVVLCTRATSVS
ncbi:MAG: hypothetical protein AAB250_19015, partial [Bdellovibrionota bacterium]